ARVHAWAGHRDPARARWRLRSAPGWCASLRTRMGAHRAPQQPRAAILAPHSMRLGGGGGLTTTDETTRATPSTGNTVVVGALHLTAHDHITSALGARVWCLMSI